MNLCCQEEERREVEGSGDEELYVRINHRGQRNERRDEAREESMESRRWKLKTASVEENYRGQKRWNEGRETKTGAWRETVAVKRKRKGK